MTAPSELSARWRTRGDELDPYAPAAAAAFRTAAAELEEELQAEKEDLLSPAEAVPFSGSSARTLRDHVARGSLKNYGKKGSPLYKRGELPTRSKGRGDAGGFDAESHVIGIVGGESP